LQNDKKYIYKKFLMDADLGPFQFWSPLGWLLTRTDGPASTSRYVRVLELEAAAAAAAAYPDRPRPPLLKLGLLESARAPRLLLGFHLHRRRPDEAPPTRTPRSRLGISHEPVGAASGSQEVSPRLHADSIHIQILFYSHLVCSFRFVSYGVAGTWTRSFRVSESLHFTSQIPIFYLCNLSTSNLKSQ
jgi:hypothetical protein